VIDNALAQAAGRGMRLTLRVLAYNSCCSRQPKRHEHRNPRLGARHSWHQHQLSWAAHRFVHEPSDPSRTELE
jgi:hypothetical protein